VTLMQVVGCLTLYLIFLHGIKMKIISAQQAKTSNIYKNTKLNIYVVMPGNSEGLFGLFVFGNKWRNIQLIVSSEPQWVSCMLHFHIVLAFF